MSKLATFIIILVLCLPTKSYGSDRHQLHIIMIPVFPCTEAGLETNVATSLSIGAMGGSCVDHRTANGEKKRNDVENTFTRLRLNLNYSFNKPIFASSWRVMVLSGMESDEFRTDAGSNATVVFWFAAANLSYLYVTDFGFTIKGGVGYGHLRSAHSQRDIADAETKDTKEFLDRNTSSTT